VREDDAHIDDWSRLLFEQATLAEGGQLQDPLARARMNAMLLGGESTAAGAPAGATRAAKRAARRRKVTERVTEPAPLRGLARSSRRTRGCSCSAAFRRGVAGGRNYYAHPRNPSGRSSAKCSASRCTSGRPAPLPSVARRGTRDLGSLRSVPPRGSPRQRDPRGAANDFAHLPPHCAQPGAVLFNGKAAGRFEPRFRDAGYRTRVMPSTSPAYASMPRERKHALWREALETLR